MTFLTKKLGTKSMAPWSRDGPELPAAVFKKAKTKVERDNLSMI